MNIRSSAKFWSVFCMLYVVVRTASKPAMADTLWSPNVSPQLSTVLNVQLKLS